MNTMKYIFVSIVEFFAVIIFSIGTEIILETLSAFIPEEQNNF